VRDTETGEEERELEDCCRCLMIFGVGREPINPKDNELANQITAVSKITTSFPFAFNTTPATLLLKKISDF